MRFVFSQTPPGSSMGKQALQGANSIDFWFALETAVCVRVSMCMGVCGHVSVEGYSGSRDWVGGEGISELG